MKKRTRTIMVFVASMLMCLVFGVLFIVVGVNTIKLNFMAIGFIISGTGSLIFVGIASTLMWFYLKIHDRSDEDNEVD